MTLLIQSKSELLSNLPSDYNFIFWMITFILVIIMSKAVFSKPSKSSPKTKESANPPIRIVMVPPTDRGRFFNMLPGLLVVVAGILLVTGRADILASAVSGVIDLIKGMLDAAGY